MLRGVRGAADVVPDQIVGKGYVEIKIDRKKAARYGINVGDIQDVVEVAMGGKPLTMTVEGRERYPVRVRYARAFRDDVEALKRILVSARCADGRRRGRRAGMAWAWERRMPSTRRPPAAAAAPDPAGRGRRHPGGRGAVDDQERERPAPRLRPAHASATATRSASSRRPRRVVDREGQASRRACTSNGRAQFEHQVRAQQDAADRLPGRHRRDRADPLPDAQELDRRRC